MANTIRGVNWHLDKGDDAISHLEGFLSWPRRVGFPGTHKWLIDLLDGIVLQKEKQFPLNNDFEITQPLWFGLWTRSPLNISQCSLLHDLLFEMGEQIGEALVSELEQRHRENPDKFSTVELMQQEQIFSEDHQNLSEFLFALKVAITHNIPMHVTLAPSGHADFGFITTFHHCPHCKADPPMEKLDDIEVNCPVCRTTYKPRETFSIEKDPIMELLEELESKNKK